MPAVAVKRGCGSRKEGGVYLECGLSPNGSPIETFLFDPPLTDVPAEWLKPHRNPELFERDGAWHAVIWVGEEFYPNVWDFIEETRVAGASRRVPKSFDFSKLTPQSRMYFVHAAADVSVELEQSATAPTYQAMSLHCPKTVHMAVLDQAIRDVPHCLGLAKYLRAETPGEYQEVECDHADPTTVPTAIVKGRTRTLPCGHSYSMFERPAGVLLPITPAIFLQLPVTGICCVQKADGTFDEGVKARVDQAHVDVYESEV